MMRLREMIIEVFSQASRGGGPSEVATQTVDMYSDLIFSGKN
jgi:hypothetical protein